MVTSAEALTADSAQPTNVISPDAEFSTFQREANARDLAEKRGEAPKSEESAPSTKQEPPVEGEANSAEPDSETAAAPETAPPQERGPKESEYKKLRRINRELRERIARMEGERDGRQEREPSRPAAESQPQTQQASAQSTRPEPKIDDTDPKTGQPKYAKYEEWLADLRKWDREQILAEARADLSKTQKETAQRQHEQVISQEWGKRVTKAREKHADYDTVALNPDLPIKQGSPVDMFILDSEHGTEVLYQLGKDPERLAWINGLNPLAQVRELTKIEMKLTGPPPARRITNAPPPVRTVNANTQGHRDEVEGAVQDEDFAAYRRSANARDLARAKGR